MANIGDNPRLAGILQRAREINDNGVPRDVSSDVAESIIDSCRDGVAPKSGALFIAVGWEQLFLDLRNDLKLVRNGSSSLRIINGELGAGKSFLLRVIEEYAIEHNFATSFITLSNRECPMWTHRREIEPFTAQELSHSLKSGKLLGNQRIPEERNATNGQGLCYTPQGARGASKRPLCCP